MKLFFLLAFFIPMHVWAQGYQPGYVITNSGDTIHGLLKHPFGNPYGFAFKDSNNAKKDFPKQEVEAFYIEKDGSYRKILFMKDSRVYMVSVIVEGYLSYYEVQTGVSSDSYYHILQKKGNADQYWYSADIFQGFKTGIVKFLSDDPVLCGKINNGEYGKKDILAIVRAYNSFHESEMK